MEGHIVEGCDSEDDTGVACRDGLISWKKLDGDMIPYLSDWGKRERCSLLPHRRPFESPW